MNKECIWPRNRCATKGPYSPAVAFGNLVFVSGQGPVDLETGDLVKGSFEEEMKLALDNVCTILEAAGSTMRNALKVTVYLSDIQNFSRMNDLYESYFKPHFPARTTVQAGNLPFGIQFEVEVIAYREGQQTQSKT